jgi:hypothetical protein
VCSLASAQTLDLTGPPRPELGGRSVVSRALESVVDARRNPPADANPNKPANEDTRERNLASLSRAALAARAVRTWDALTERVLETAVEALDPAQHELDAVVGLTMSRRRGAVVALVERFVQTSDLLADTSPVQPRSTEQHGGLAHHDATLARMALMRFVAEGERVLRTPRPVLTTLSDDDVARDATASSVVAQMATAIHALREVERWLGPLNTHERAATSNETAAVTVTAQDELRSHAKALRSTVARLNDEDIDATAKRSVLDFAAFLDVTAQVEDDRLDAGHARTLVTAAADLERALGLPGLVRTTRWVRRRDIDTSREAISGSLAAAPFGAAATQDDDFAGERSVHGAANRFSLLSRVVTVIDGVERLRRERINTDGGERATRSLLAATARMLNARDAASTGDLKTLARSTRVAERVVRLMTKRRELPELGDVDPALKPVWRVLEDEARTAEQRVLAELSDVLAADPPLIGPAGVSLVSSLADRITRLEALLRAAELARMLRAADDDAEADAGDRLWMLLQRAGDAASDPEERATMDEALAEARAFVGTYTRFEALRAGAPWLGEGGAAIAQQFPRVTPFGRAAQLDERLLARTIAARGRYMRAWANAARSDDRPRTFERRAESELALDALERVAQLLDARALIDHSRARIVLHPAIDLTDAEFEHLLQAAGSPMLNAAAQLGGGNIDRARNVLARLEREAAPLRVLAAVARDGRSRLNGTARFLTPLEAELESERRGNRHRDPYANSLRSAASLTVADELATLDMLHESEGLNERWAALAAVSRWVSERAAVARSIDPSPLNAIDAYLIEQAERALAVLAQRP